jgi:hypothetical protein
MADDLIAASGLRRIPPDHSAAGEPCAVLRVGGRELVLRSGEVRVLGRDAAVADIVVESAVVSRRHVAVRSTGSAIVAEDLGSSNGTDLVSGGERTELEPGLPVELPVGSRLWVLDELELLVFEGFRLA